MRLSEPLPIGRGVRLGPAPGGYAGDGLDADLDAMAGLGFSALVCLIEAEEFAHLDGEPHPLAYLAGC